LIASVEVIYVESPTKLHWEAAYYKILHPILEAEFYRKNSGKITTAKFAFICKIRYFCESSLMILLQ
jgi:hypothetical protein